MNILPALVAAIKTHNKKAIAVGVISLVAYIYLGVDISALFVMLP